jgi:alpha,alpha-trehalase
VALPASACELVIFDLDGVLTRTAGVHAAAWKALFDGFLGRRSGGDVTPFDAHVDYLEHVDGKPRLEGVRDFLASRGIALPDGTPQDAPGDETLWALGNAKNRLFNAVLARDGIEAYAPAVALLAELEACGIRRAVVSASRNCRRILDVAGLSERVDVVVDGCDAQREGLAGKPAPDTFLAAARRLNVPPARAVVVEDAEAGVAAARAGGFGLVIGVDRDDHAGALLAHGADHVVARLDQLRPRPLPSALADLADIRARLDGQRPALFLDYDGTLTPIVARPEDACLGGAMRETLAALAARGPVVIVTGRGLEVIREMVGIEGITYAADHGFELEAEDGSAAHAAAVEGFDAVAVDVAATLRRRLRGVNGAIIEHKRFSVAVHYRLVAEAAVERVKAAVREVLAGEPRLRLLTGKKVLELEPDVAWDKGAAVEWVMRRLGVAPEQAVYVGDDVTDEAAFRLLRGVGTTVAVQEVPRPTAAGYRLADVDEVLAFLQRLAEPARAGG